jgi:hypothetical protein
MYQSLETLLKALGSENQYNFDRLVDSIRVNKSLRLNFSEVESELKKTPNNILNSHIQLDENPFQMIYTPMIYSLLFMTEFVKMLRKN